MRLDQDLIFVNLNTANSGKTLTAFDLITGNLYKSENATLTHSTPVVATIQGVRQVIFATEG